MFKQVFLTIITWMASCFQVLKSFVLDETLHITYFHFLLFGVFITIAIRLVNFIKQVQEVESENEKNRYQAWLRDHPSNPRRSR